MVLYRIATRIINFVEYHVFALGVKNEGNLRFIDLVP